MEKLVPNWYSAAQPLPETYIFPPDARPGKFSVAPSISNDIPVIDLGSQSHDRALVIQQILEASQEFGFFQVINHGIPEALMNDTMDVFKEFFELPLEEKRASIYSDDPNKVCKLVHSSVNYDWEEVHLWRDFLRHPCEPLEKFMPIWPRKPIKYREHVSKCFTQVKKVALDILELIGEGLGIGSEYFNDELSKETDIFVNHYPPCPDPSLTLGITKHSDPQLITILLQGDVSGLQVLKDGEWIGVEPISNGLVVNIGYQLRIISNGKLKCAEHRVVTNSSTVRTTIGFFITPSPDCYIEPAAALINASNPRLYKGFRYEEFRANYFRKQGKTEVVLEPFKIES
ncbi:hyoscyamine 6-dioxygenase-like [Rosa sericea]|uniref:hyoscyamine 6-dioxygenase-like n=1 Tax=Rosa rugosa TaxID=74645 RepID=UPI002B407235|nr:hyoscyamine 6-dioxygenase-like [Rosa rugosa]